jgi:Patatin-like phospholipase
MKKIVLLLTSLALSGCVSLGARPQSYDCKSSKDYQTLYLTAPITSEIQLEGFADLEPTFFAAHAMATDGRSSWSADPLYKILGGDSGVSPLVVGTPSPKKLLLLSGGGQWGAFGAGFLRAIHENNESDYDAINGVSTGALQALLIGVGGYPLLFEEYDGIKERDLIKTGGLLSALTKGYLNDTDPLRKRLEQLLCEDDTTCSGIEKLAAAKSQIFVGGVEAATGQFHSFDISKMARAAYPRGVATKMTPKEAQQCIVGAVMGSIAMPAFLRPARINHQVKNGNEIRSVQSVYVDGGVRHSVFEAVAADIARRVSENTSNQVELYVVRNGPTVLQPDSKQSGSGAYEVDAKPDIAKVVMRGYSTIVNQSEVMSLAALRLSRPTGAIRYISADGYRAEAKCTRTEANGKPGKAMFDAGFMQCLMAWGKRRAQRDWRVLPPAMMTGGAQNAKAESPAPSPNDI